MRNVKGKNVPIGDSKPHGSGEISFYDVGQRKKVSIARSGITSTKLPNGKYRLTAKAPQNNKAGKPYNLHTFSSNPA